MPLSEQEQRLLDEMERNLLHHDADVVSAAPSGRAFSYRNLVLGALVIIVGLIALVAGVALYQSLASAGYVGIIVGVVGFVLMFAGAMLAMRRTSIEGYVPPAETTTSGARSSADYERRDQSFMDRMNDRWDRRHDGDH